MTNTPPATPTRRRADAIANRRAIIEAAMTVLADTPNATLADIAAAANLARRTVYLHFSSRDELVLAAARDIGEQIAARVAATPDSDEPLHTLAQFVHANSSAVAQLHRLAGLTAVTGAREELSAATEIVRERIAGLLHAAQQRGDLDHRIPPRAGMHIAAAIQWGVFEAVSTQDLDPADAATVAVRSVLGSIGAHPVTIESILTRVQHTNERPIPTETATQR
jgi:AcrR family transcriptional regulator